MSKFNWNKGDEIEMKLDLTKQTLSYIINDEKIVTIDNVYNDFKDKPDVRCRTENNMRDRDLTLLRLNLYRMNVLYC